MMSTLVLNTVRLRLVLETSDAVLARIDALSPEDRAQVSPDWIARMRESPTSPWTHGFAITARATNAVIGSCAFKGPPGEDGAVEIAYGLDSDYRGHGYAKEAARALVDFAFSDDDVRIVCAHTLPNTSPSTSVLTACGFKFVGEVVDPEDGLVWRWERLPEQPHDASDDAFRGREPTSHERMTGVPWNASYGDGPAPWDIGKPQPVVARLASSGAFTGEVLDAGCGTGENTLHIASLGLSVLGVDVAETAIEMARQKARDRGIEVDFETADALRLERLGRVFDTVLDVGLFHTFGADERARYAASVASVTTAGGVFYVLCFSNEGSDIGPHPIGEDEIRTTFNASGAWEILRITAERVSTRFHHAGAPAWLATVKRL